MVAILPHSVRKLYRRIAIAVYLRYKLLVGKEAGLWESVHSIPDLDGNFSIAWNVTQVVLVNDLVWDVG